ncbi:MAG: multicopper oxidase domain-containing protein [Nocardioidaceae bacterium]|nr:multicopper oxidase domain-containing protein [Nocardioidaceae bacterium]NUS52976.1 multicopper oxidase domain-containing protein [Nocardioidaceae bacterium]
MSVSRRDLLKIGVVGGAALALPLERVGLAGTPDNRMPTSKLPARFTLPFVRPPELKPSGSWRMRCPDGMMRSYPRYDVRQQFTVAEILPGYKTPIFGYNGVTPGPTIRVRRGSPIVVRQANSLQRPPAAPYQNVPMPSRYTNDPNQRSTSTHLHGSASLPQFDGYASDITAPGQVKTYFYPNAQEARTLWYHDHGVHHTSQNAYNGLAAMYVLHDEKERRMGIPSGANPTTRRYDVPMVVRDAMFATDGGLVYDDNSESGVYGDVPLINGVPWPVMDVEPRIYRFRILNASVSRSYNWQLHDGRAPVPMTVVGTDAGLVPKPQTVMTLRHGMAERYEVVIDFAKYKGAQLTLRNISPKNNVDYEGMDQVMRFRVGRAAPTSTYGNSISPNWQERVENAECMDWDLPGLRSQGVAEREFTFIRTHGQWTINGETWEEVIDSGYTHCMAEMDEGAVEIWKLTNSSGGWFHPVHIHLVDFQVLSRNGNPANVKPFEKGPKDVVYVGENETVEVAMRFAGPKAGPGWRTPRGRYMMHCHNLVHEDHDMMMQFGVGDPDHAPDIDPITAQYPEWEA